MAKRTMIKLPPGVEERGRNRFSDFMGPSPAAVSVNPTMPGMAPMAPASAAPRRTMDLPTVDRGFAGAAAPRAPMPTMTSGADRMTAMKAAASASFGIANAHPMRRGGGGRSANDPDRIAEQMRRRGDPRFIMQRAAQREGQDFSREMFGAQQSAMDMRFERGQAMQAQQDQARLDQGLTMFELNRQQRAEESDVDYQRRMEMMRQEQEAQQGFSTQPVDPNDPAKGSVILRGDGRLFNHIPGQPAQPPIPEGLEPKQATRNGVTYGQAEAQTNQGPEIEWQKNSMGDMVPYQKEIDPQTGRVVFRVVPILDVNNDGVDDRTQGGGAPGGGGQRPSSFAEMMKNRR